MTHHRNSRGWLSTLDLLPAIARPDIDWARSRLRERSMQQKAIMAQLNDRLAAKGLPAVSKSAFSRWSVREVRRMLDEEDASGMDEACAEFVAVAIAQSLVDRTDANSIMALSTAFRSAASRLADPGDTFNVMPADTVR